MRGARRGLWLLAGGIILAGTAQAQDRAALPPGAVVQPLDDGPGAELRRNLTTLAQNPRSMSALVGAGRAALAMGDGEAALSFFTRADEVMPRDARVRAGMASALVLMERGETALTLFAEAEALGAPTVEIARDRGLAYDMTGDPRRAQQDYALALRRGDDPELRRRMALSLAISGQRDAALRMIDDQLRRHDRAAWRTQAFVLALTGDARGANDTASRMMPAGAALSMAPFFARLGALSPAQKAMAVHFGRFPSDGRVMAGTGVDTGADPGAVALAQGGAPSALPRPREPVPETREPRRRPGGRPREVGSVVRRSRDTVAPPVRRPVETAQAEPRRFEPPPPEPEPQAPAPEPEPEPQAPEPDPAPIEAPPPSAPVAETFGPALAEVAPGFTLSPAGAQPIIEPAPVSAPATQTAAAVGLGDLVPVLEGLPDPETPAPPAPARAEPRPPRAVEPRPAPRREAAARRPPPPAHPSRHWVQVAGGANRAALPATFARLRERAPALLASRAPYTTPLNQTNRLLVGPFDSSRAAQAFVNQLAERDIAAFAWTSPAGQEIDRLRIANEPRSTRSRPEPEQRPAARGRRTRQ